MKKVIYSGVSSFALLPNEINVNKEKKVIYLFFEDLQESEVLDYLEIAITEEIEIHVCGVSMQMWLPAKNVTGIYNL